jgi:hypothetical protein
MAWSLGLIGMSAGESKRAILVPISPGKYKWALPIPDGIAEQIEDTCAYSAADHEEFVRVVGSQKLAEELTIRCACMSPFLRGFATPKTRKELVRPGRPLGIVLTRETASMLSDADPPRDDWCHHAFGSGVGQDSLSGVYVDVPHGRLLVGEGLQIRAIFAIPGMTENESGELHWGGSVLVHALVAVAGSEHESGSVYAKVSSDDARPSALASDPQTPLGGITIDGLAPAGGEDTALAIYLRVMEHSVRFLRMTLAYRRYGPAGSQQAIGQTPAERVAMNRFKPKKGESLFAMTRLLPAADNLGRPDKIMNVGWSLTARQEVSGHFRLQPYGPGASLRRLSWVAAYERGPADGPSKPPAVRM